MSSDATMPNPDHALKAAERLAQLLENQGWAVELESHRGSASPDLIARKGKIRYAAELKYAREGRPDRVLPLLSQAILQSSRYARDGAMRPLAVIFVDQISSSLHRKVERFHKEYAPDVAVGLVAEKGANYFAGPGLDALGAAPVQYRIANQPVMPRHATELFSDLNQWMLKVLLAPELPERMLRAPRHMYGTATELADAAQVSAMSASRFLRRLREEGFLDETTGSLRLVRRRELFRRWQSAAMRSSPELRMSFVVPGAGVKQLQKTASRLDACIGLFTAADLLQLGHVSGATPYVYVRRLSPSTPWPCLLPIQPGETPQLILKQANTPNSIFRGAVQTGGLLVSDVLQIWLDTSVHASRGAEQADFLERKVLSRMLGE